MWLSSGVNFTCGIIDYESNTAYCWGIASPVYTSMVGAAELSCWNDCVVVTTTGAIPHRLPSQNFTYFMSPPRGSPLQWNDIASSADGSRLAVTGGTNGVNNVWTSYDGGVSWTKRAPNLNYVSVAISADGAKMAAICYQGNTWTSVDYGQTWSGPLGPSSNFRGITSSSNGNKLASASNSETLYTSTDGGATWTPRATILSWFHRCHLRTERSLQQCEWRIHFYER